MQRIIDTAPIIEVLRQADTKVQARDLLSVYEGIVVEITDGIAFEGTLVYFPGVQLKELKASMGTV
jgi:hypothetical protein